MIKNIILVTAIISFFSILIATAYAMSIDNIKLDNSGRREYVYCPINPNLLSNVTTYDINGCPTVRIYVDNWNRLTELEKSNIDNQLRISGFRDAN